MTDFSKKVFGDLSRITLALFLIMPCVSAVAESGGQTANDKVAIRAPQALSPAMRLTDNNDLVLSAAPREDRKSVV